LSRITAITLDAGQRGPAVAAEREKIISELLQENVFDLKGERGPYSLVISLQEDRLVIDAACDATGHREDLRLPLAPLRRQIKDYALICDNFQKMAQEGHIHKLEAIDMGRRALHDEGAALVVEALDGKVLLDKPTARRLFSLVYMLHLRTIHP